MLCRRVGWCGRRAGLPAKGRIDRSFGRLELHAARGLWPRPLNCAVLDANVMPHYHQMELAPILLLVPFGGISCVSCSAPQGNSPPKEEGSRQFLLAHWFGPPASSRHSGRRSVCPYGGPEELAAAALLTATRERGLRCNCTLGWAGRENISIGTSRSLKVSKLGRAEQGTGHNGSPGPDPCHRCWVSYREL